MQASDNLPMDTSLTELPEFDDIAATIAQSWHDLFNLNRPEAEAFQLENVRRRFDEQRPLLRSLQTHSERVGVDRIERLEDVAKLLFQDAVYKSYPASLIENNRFDHLTRWLAGYTTIDLSNTDVSACNSIDGWIDTLEAQTSLRIVHTSGTSGKLSLFARSNIEVGIFFRCFMKVLEGLGGSPGVHLGYPVNLKIPVVFPVPRYGRYLAQRTLRMIENFVTPTPDQLYTLNSGTLSADLVSLSGRIRVAQSKGDLSSIKLNDPMRVAMRRYLEELERRPQESVDFFTRIVSELQGQQVFVSSTANILYSAAVMGLERGIRHVFAADSIGLTGGGGKDIVLPENWLEVVREFTGITNWKMTYAMTELLGSMPMGTDGWYHIPPYIIPFLFDPETGQLLPREGVVTGRFAAHDLLPQTNWGGVITGDEVTIDWNGASADGQKGPRIRADIKRYSAVVTGEDKISCSATVDQTDTALQALLNL